MSIIKEIRKDSQYLKFKELLVQVQKRVDVDTDTKQVMALHESRVSRSLRGSEKYSAQKLVDANMQDLAVRSRLVQIRIKNSRQLDHLQAGVKAIRAHIISEYADDLSDDYKTQAQRTAVVDRVIRSALEFIAAVESLNATIDLVVKDVDQASFHLKGVVELLKLLAETKGRVI